MIIKQVEAPNGAATGAHIVREIVIVGPMTHAKVQISSFASEAAYLAGGGMLWNTPLEILLEAIPGDIVNGIENWLTTDTSSPLYGGVIEADKRDSLDACKQRQRARINAWWLAANNSYFEFKGERISYEEDDRVDIQGIYNTIMLTGAMPVDPDWPGAWKTMNDTWVPIPDMATWIEFNVAISNRGTAHFKHAQMLKRELDAAETLEQVAAVIW